MPVTDLEDLITVAARNDATSVSVETFAYTAPDVYPPIAIPSPISATEVTRAEAMLTLSTYGRTCVALAIRGNNPDFLTVVDRHGALESLGLSIESDASPADIQQMLDSKHVAENYTAGAVKLRNAALSALADYATGGHLYVQTTLATTAQRAAAVRASVADKTVDDSTFAAMMSYAVPMPDMMAAVDSLNTLAVTDLHLAASPIATSIYVPGQHDTAAAAVALNDIFNGVSALTGSTLTPDLTFSADADWTLAYRYQSFDDHGYTGESMEALHQMVDLLNDQCSHRTARDVSRIVAELGEHPRPLYAARVANAILGYMKTVDRSVVDMAALAQSSMRTLAACYQ